MPNITRKRLLRMYSEAMDAIRPTRAAVTFARPSTSRGKTLRGHEPGVSILGKDLDVWAT
jgi:hypothetical protein